MGKITTTVDGKEIEHKDVLYHEINGLSFGFWSRLKILFGKKLSIHVNYYTMNNKIKLVDSSTKILFQGMFKKNYQDGKNC